MCILLVSAEIHQRKCKAQNHNHHQKTSNETSLIFIEKNHNSTGGKTSKGIKSRDPIMRGTKNNTGIKDNII